MPTSKGRTPTSSRVIVTTTDSKMEVGNNWHGFITYLPKIFKKYYSIIVVVDKLSKETHFIIVKYTYKVVNIAYIFMKEIFRLHGILKVIVYIKTQNLQETFGNLCLKG